jgi:hypothetical protein
MIMETKQKDTDSWMIEKKMIAVVMYEKPKREMEMEEEIEKVPGSGMATSLSTMMGPALRPTPQAQHRYEQQQHAGSPSTASMNRGASSSP